MDIKKICGLLIVITPVVSAMTEVRILAESAPANQKPKGSYVINGTQSLSPVTTQLLEKRTKLPIQVKDQEKHNEKENENNHSWAHFFKRGVVRAIARVISYTAYATHEFINCSERVIPAYFKDAIVRVYSEGSQGSGTVLRGQDGKYYVLTAAHCIEENKKCYIEAYDNMKAYRLYNIKPLLIDTTHDIALLHIPAREVVKYRARTYQMLPAIWVDYLSTNKPQPGYLLASAGYPGFVPKGQYTPYNINGVMACAETIKIRNGPERYCMTIRPLSQERCINGASGSPLFTFEQDGQPRLSCIVSASQPSENIKGEIFTVFVYGAGAGQLPQFFEKAEKILQEQARQEYRMGAPLKNKNTATT